MGSELSKNEEAARIACAEFDLHNTKKAFANSSPSDPIDLFKIVSNKDSPVKRDYFTLALYGGGSNLNFPPFLEPFKQELEKNNAIIAKSSSDGSSKKKQFTPPQLDQLEGGYLELIARNRPADLTSFKFLLDNAELFPLFKQTTDCPSSILHDICGQSTSATNNNNTLPLLLQELISSGHVPTVFKNNTTNNNDLDPNKKMRHPKYDNMTPLQYACSKLNAEAVTEMCVAGIGGTNLTECVKTICIDALPDKIKCKHNEEQRVIDIFLTLISQPNGGGDALRNLKFDANSIANLHGNHLSSTTLRSKVRDVVGVELLPFSSTNDSSSVVYPTFLVLGLGHFSLFTTLRSNGFRVIDDDLLDQKKRKEASHVFWNKCKYIPNKDKEKDAYGSESFQYVKNALVKIKLHEWLIDIDAAFVFSDADDTTLMSSLEVLGWKISNSTSSFSADEVNSDLVHARALLIEAGAKDVERATYEARVDKIMSGQEQLPYYSQDLVKFCFELAIRGYVSAMSKFLKLCTEKNRLEDLCSGGEFSYQQLFVDIVRCDGSKHEVIELMLNVFREHLGDEIMKKNIFEIIRRDILAEREESFLEIVLSSPRLSVETLRVLFECMQKVGDKSYIKKILEADNKTKRSHPFWALCQNLNNFKSTETAIGLLKTFFEIARTTEGDGYLKHILMAPITINKILSNHRIEVQSLPPFAVVIDNNSEAGEIVRFFADVLYSTGLFAIEYKKIASDSTRKVIAGRFGITKDFKGSSPSSSK